MNFFAKFGHLTSAIAFTSLSTGAAALAGDMKDFGCGEPTAHYPLNIDNICYGSNTTEVGYAIWLRTENEGNIVSFYRLSSERLATEANPIVDHTLFATDGTKVGHATLTHVVEDARYPGDGEDRVVALKVSLDNGTVFKAYINPVHESPASSL